MSYGLRYEVLLFYQLKTKWSLFNLQVLECGVCEDVFSLQGDKVPRLLLCGHTVCHDCLTRLPLHGRAVRCPFDRQVTELGKKTCLKFLKPTSQGYLEENTRYSFLMLHLVIVFPSNECAVFLFIQRSS